MPPCSLACTVGWAAVDGAASVRTLVENDREELVQFFGSVGFEPAELTALVRSI